jgi:hypothetical protein
VSQVQKHTQPKKGREKGNKKRRMRKKQQNKADKKERMNKYQVGLKKLLTYKTPYISIQKSQEIEIEIRIFSSSANLWSDLIEPLQVSL